MFEVTHASAPRFCFRADDPSALHVDKFLGIRRYGPYQPLSDNRPLRLGFLFPNEYRDQANLLFRALRNGIRTFPGIQAMFGVPLEVSSVVRIAEFSISRCESAEAEAREYESAFNSWDSDVVPVDILIVLHKKTSVWQDTTPYYRTKAAAFSRGVPSQHVTIDLLDDAYQLQWSVAEIALQLFVKLGGIPWIVEQPASRPSVIIGVGRTQLLTEAGLPGDTQTAFATCVTSKGPLLFSTVGSLVDSQAEYLSMLASVVNGALKSAVEQGEMPQHVTVHLTEQFGRDEREAVQAAMDGSPVSRETQSYLVTLSRERDFFFVDRGDPTGAPPRGTTVILDRRQRLVYTEGREERKSQQFRMPTAIRIRASTAPDDSSLGLIAEEAFRLSLVNYRGFRSFAEPATMVYARLIARFLSHLSAEHADAVRARAATGVFGERMWFL